MRSGFSVLLIATLIFAGGYLYYVAEAVCPAPLTYSLGQLDSRFNLSNEEARLIIAEAESVWEDATGRNLFSYAEDGDLVVNFVFDERQQLSNAEDSLKEKLDATENVGDALRDTYATLVTNYNKLRLEYTAKAESYEKKLQAYNQEVEKYNSRGGAPADVYAQLAQEKKDLAQEQTQLNAQSNKLNALVAEINGVGEKANTIINTYNQGVGVYNKAFGEPREFTQGDYTNKTITIYKFDTEKELALVLAHELGHSLSLDHVEGKQSIMYYLIGDQPSDISLSAQDMDEFNRICGEKSIWEKLQILLQAQKELLSNK